jgi:hypothetical protein
MAPAGPAPPATVIMCRSKIIVIDASMMRCVLAELRKACQPSGDDVMSGIAKGDSSLLAELVKVIGDYCQGFQQAARVKKAWLAGSVVKRLVHPDGAFSELRHFAEVGWPDLKANAILMQHLVSLQVSLITPTAPTLMLHSAAGLPTWSLAKTWIARSTAREDGRSA